MDSLVDNFHRLTTWAAGAGVNEIAGEKLELIMRGLFLLFIFCVIFFFVYRHFFWKEAESRKLFWWSVSALLLLVVSKYILFHFSKGYISDRLIIYAIPSPKIYGLGWFLLPVAIFALFMFFYKKIMTLSAGKFLAALWASFVAFALSVAATRLGRYGILENFSRTGMQYTGELEKIKNIGDYLHNFISTHSIWYMNHAVTHPPGYPLLLYLFQKFFHVEFLGLSILAVMFGALAIIPIYYFLKELISEEAARFGLVIYIFLPGTVLMGATSMDFTFVFVVWLAFILIFKGWRMNWLLAFLGGITAAIALFMNFLFLLTAPLFVYFLYSAYAKAASIKKILAYPIFSLLGFTVFFLILFYATGYSIIENFNTARSMQALSIGNSNFDSVGLYLTYAFMNISAFFVYLGVPNLIVLIKKHSSLRQVCQMGLVGFPTVALFVLIGIFQGEVERIWLFITPLFILPLVFIITNYFQKQYAAILALLFFQSIIIQILFYTYY